MTENTSLTKVAENLDAKIENSVSRMEKIEEKFPSLPIDEQELVRVSKCFYMSFFSDNLKWRKPLMSDAHSNTVITFSEIILKNY